MKYTITEPENDSAIIAVGGAEVHVRTGSNGALLIDVKAPGKLDPKVLLLDEDGDAYVAFLRNGEQQLAVDLKPTVK